MVEVCSPHVRMRDSHIPRYTSICMYTFHSFLALNYVHMTSEASNCYTIFVLMLINRSKFRGLATWLRCVLHT